MITYITTLILFVLLSSLEGLEQAFYYHSSVITGDSDKYNLHPIFFVQRGIVAIFIALSTSWLMIPILMLVFSYFHNSSYYCKRNDLDSSLYPKRWKDESTTSMAILNFSYKNRLIQFIIGIVVFLGLLIYKFY